MEKEYTFNVQVTVRKGSDVIQTVELVNFLLDYENLVELQTNVAGAVMSALSAMGQARVKSKKG